MSTSIHHRSTVVFRMPAHVPDLLKAGESVVTAMTANPSFPGPTPPLATVSALLAARGTAETEMKTRTKGTRETRDKAQADLVTALHGLKSYVQGVADASGDDAPAVIASAGMGVRKATVRNKPEFVAKPGATSGTVHLAAKAAARRASYEWEWSGDGGKTWTQLPSTLQAKTTIVGLPV